jgi:hypothetical protein
VPTLPRTANGKPDRPGVVAAVTAAVTAAG